MRIRVDKESDALHLRISEDKVIESEEIAPGIIIDYGKNGKILGLEIIGLKEKFSTSEVSKVEVDLPT
ncbi:MAG: DUF2283 domain-containing protein [Candidatus Zixiibacteriota bacterium]